MIPPPSTYWGYDTVHFARWSADSAYLALNRSYQDASYSPTPQYETDLYVVKASDLSLLPIYLPRSMLQNAQTTFSWSPVGHQFAYLGEGGLLLVGSLEKGIEKQFRLSSPDEVGDVAPIWSPNGQYVVIPYLHQYDTWFYDIFGLDGSATLAIPGSSTNHNSVLALPDDVLPLYDRWLDGQRWLFTQPETSTNPTLEGLKVFNAKHQTFQTLVEHVDTGIGSHFDRLHVGVPIDIVSSAAARLAVTSHQNDKFAVTLMDDDGSHKVSLVTDATDVNDLRWSPDGKFVVVVTLLQDTGQTSQQLVVAQADGSGQHVYSFKAVRIIGWSGDSFLYIAQSTLYRVDPELKSLWPAQLQSDILAGLLDAASGAMTKTIIDRQTVTMPEEDAPFNAEWSLTPSPDEQYFVLNFFQRYPIPFNVIYILNRTGQLVRRYDSAYSPQWSPDGTMLAFMRNDTELSAAETIRIVRLDGSVIWQYRVPDSADWTSDMFWTACPF